MNLIKYFIAAFLFLILFFFSISLTSQELICFNSNNPIAKTHYNETMYEIYQEIYDTVSNYPARGMYSPTSYGLGNYKSGTGDCNYIYISTNELLKPGTQYTISLELEVVKEYDDMPYFQDHLGMALSSDLYHNDFGLWIKHFVPLGKLETEKIIPITFNFRPLCTSKYIIIGVFQGETMDEQHCPICPHEFKLYSLTVNKASDLDSDFYYICDGHVEKKINKWNFTTDTIFFDSGSSVIKNKYLSLLDSIPSKLSTVQDIISLYAHTDKKGEDNENLGLERNEAVKKALLERGIDSTRITTVNYGETKASDIISPKDRKVEIDINLDKLYQKYYTQALNYALEDDFGKANKAIRKWLSLVPPERAIYALFDCWGDSRKARFFKRDLREKIKSQFYRKKSLKFTLDSLHCENPYSDISYNITLNHLHTYDNHCDQKEESSSQRLLKEKQLFGRAQQLYSKHGFPTVKEVGIWGNSALPSIMLQSDDLEYLQKLLPIFREACEKQLINWRYYAMLYDKIAVKQTGFQYYGTKTYIGSDNKIAFRNPLENVSMINEYRKQVKLIPYPQKVIEETEDNQQKIDKTLVSTLNTIYQSDQKYRRQTDEIEDEFGIDSDTLVAHWKLINKANSLNLIKVKEILDNRGWLSPQIIGNQGSNTLFLVIQHSDLETQLKYLPMMRKAVKLGNAKASELALLEDRVAIRQGKKQIYGSQIGRDSTGVYYVEPIAEPEKVNERRAKIGLGTIEKYLSNWGIEWRMEN